MDDKFYCWMLQKRVLKYAFSRKVRLTGAAVLYTLYYSSLMDVLVSGWMLTLYTIHRPQSSSGQIGLPPLPTHKTLTAHHVTEERGSFKHPTVVPQIQRRWSDEPSRVVPSIMKTKESSHLLLLKSFRMH